jgi:hypothetical protein
MRLTSPHDILSAYSNGSISSSQAIARLQLGGYRDLVVAMADAGHALPRPSQAEIDRQLEDALPILRAALLPSDDGRA